MAATIASHNPDAVRAAKHILNNCALVDVATQAVTKIGAPAMIRSIDPAPDGQHARVTRMTKPFAYVVPVNSFGQVEEVWDGTGTSLVELSSRPINLGVRAAGAAAGRGGRGGGANQTGRRADRNPRGHDEPETPGEDRNVEGETLEPHTSTTGDGGGPDREHRKGRDPEKGQLRHLEVVPRGGAEDHRQEKQGRAEEEVNRPFGGELAPRRGGVSRGESGVGERCYRHAETIAYRHLLLARRKGGMIRKRAEFRAV